VTETDVPNPNGEEPGKRSRDLPSQRLSPVLNPLLANQLGRWAEIYYTTPADRRDEAVGKLLRELEAEAGSGHISSQEAPSTTNAPAAAVSPADLQPSEKSDEVALEAFVPLEERPLLVSSPPPQASDTEASPLNTELSEPRFSSEWEEHVLPWPGRQAVAASSIDSLRVEESLPASIPVPDIQTMEAVETQAIEEVDVVDPQRKSPTEQVLASADAVIAAPVDHLPEMAPEPEAYESPELLEPETASTGARHDPTDFSSFHLPHETPLAPDKRWIPRGLAAAALLIVGSALLVWTLHRGPAPVNTASSQPHVAGSDQSGAGLPPAVSEDKIPTAAENVNSAPPKSPQTPERHVTSGSTASQAQKPAAERSVIQRSVIERSDKRPLAQGADNSKSGAETAAPEKSAEPADPDLQAGLKYLHGDASERNSAEAARYLWKSVRRQNGRALVELAGLYASGDGVARDCDQARILLQAAARHNIPKFETALETLHRAGCE